MNWQEKPQRHGLPLCICFDLPWKLLLDSLSCAYNFVVTYSLIQIWMFLKVFLEILIIFLTRWMKFRKSAQLTPGCWSQHHWLLCILDLSLTLPGPQYPLTLIWGRLGQMIFEIPCSSRCPHFMTALASFAWLEPFLWAGLLASWSLSIGEPVWLKAVELLMFSIIC